MFKPLQHERAFETIVKQLKEAIYSGKLKPGDKLPTERELAGMFGVSRAAVRSAVLNLEQAGFLEIKKGAGGGFFIRELDFKPVRDSFKDLLRLGSASITDLAEARGALEPEAARLAAERSTTDDLVKIEKSISDLEEKMNVNLPAQPEDFNFHVYVAEGAKNPIILILMRALMDILFQSVGSYIVGPEKNEEVITQHKRILHAIKRKDTKSAYELSLEHVETMKVLFKRYENDLELKGITL